MSIPNFVRCPDPRTKGTEFADNPDDATVAAFLVGRFFDIDFDACKLYGFVEPVTPKNACLQVSFCNGDGDIVRDMEFTGHVNGQLYVQCLPGKTLEDVIRNDIVIALVAAYQKTRGVPDNIPCHCEVTVNREGSLYVTVQPFI